MWENGQTLPCLVKNVWNIAHRENFYTESCTYSQMCVCVWMLLTAARLVVEARGHEETLLGRSRRQRPLVWRKDRNHQWWELALDLLMKEGERGGGERGREEKEEVEEEWREKGRGKHEHPWHLFEWPLTDMHGKQHTNAKNSAVNVCIALSTILKTVTSELHHNNFSESYAFRLIYTYS